MHVLTQAHMCRVICCYSYHTLLLMHKLLIVEILPVNSTVEQHVLCVKTPSSTIQSLRSHSFCISWSCQQYHEMSRVPPAATLLQQRRFSMGHYLSTQSGRARECVCVFVSMLQEALDALIARSSLPMDDSHPFWLPYMQEAWWLVNSNGYHEVVF